MIRRVIVNRISILYLVAAALFFPQISLGFELAISNERSNEVWVHTPEGNVIRPLVSCLRPRGMLPQPADQTLWIACSDEDSVIRIDSKTGEVKTRVTGQIGATTLNWIEPNGRLVVSNEGASSASVIESGTGKVLAELVTGFEPDGVASADGKIFVASENAGVVHVFSAEDYSEVDALVTDLRPRRLAVSGGELWVSSEMGSKVEIFGISTLERLGEIVFSPRGFRSEQLTPVDIRFSRDGATAYVALGAANHVVIVDVKTREVEKYILVGRRAWGLELSPDEEYLFVLNGLSDDMTIIDLDRRRPIRSVRTGLVPHAVKVINP